MASKPGGKGGMGKAHIAAPRSGQNPNGAGQGSGGGPVFGGNIHGPKGIGGTNKGAH